MVRVSGGRAAHRASEPCPSTAQATLCERAILRGAGNRQFFRVAGITPCQHRPDRPNLRLRNIGLAGAGHLDFMQRDDQTDGPSRESIIGLDLLRGIAALAVFLGHARTASFVEFGALPSPQHTAIAKIFFGLTRTGHEAVLVFFVLSGYLVGGQVIKQVRQRRFLIKSYALERTTRIFLPLIPACLLTVASNWLAFGIV